MIMELVRGYALLLFASFMIYGVGKKPFAAAFGPYATRLRLRDVGGYQGETYIKGLSEL